MKTHIMPGGRFLSFLTLLAVLTTSVTLSACEAEEEEFAEDETVLQDEPMTQDPMMDISELEGDPLEYVGQTVTVDGEVSEVFGPGMFTVTGGLFTGDLPVVVPPEQQTSPVSEGDDVQLTGTVEAFVVTEIETDYGFDLTPEVEAELEESEPVLVLESMSPAGGAEGGLEQGVDNLDQEMDEEL